MTFDLRCDQRYETLKTYHEKANSDTGQEKNNSHADLLRHTQRSKSTCAVHSSWTFTFFDAFGVGERDDINCAKESSLSLDACLPT